jgi:hypothetical protein
VESGFQPQRRRGVLNGRDSRRCALEEKIILLNTQAKGDPYIDLISKEAIPIKHKVAIYLFNRVLR